jgi:hypothetical protein
LTADGLAPTLKKRKPKVKIEVKAEINEEIKVKPTFEGGAVQLMQNISPGPTLSGTEEGSKKR